LFVDFSAAHGSRTYAEIYYIERTYSAIYLWFAYQGMEHPSDPVTWLFGDAVERRIRFEQSNDRAMPSHLCRHLSGERLRLRWAEWIGAYRQSLLNPADAVSKAAEDLQIQCRDFDRNLLDVLAEILAVVRLTALGASDFTALLARTAPERPRDNSTPDFTCILGGRKAVVEVKNLREHRFAEKVMLEAYLDASVRSGMKPRFALVMLPCDRDALGRNDEGEEEIRNLVATIDEFEPRVDHTVQLPTGRVVRFRLEEGGDSRDESAITLDDLRKDEILGAEIRHKIQRTARGALKRLHSDSVHNVERRVLALRWELPFYDMLRPSGIAELLRSDLESVLALGDNPIEVLIFSDFGVELNTVRS
jgi:hypothetical protein